MLLFACPSSDDDNIEEEALFTQTNYIYEGDIRLFYLESENVRLNDSITVWEQIPMSSPLYNEAQVNIFEANTEIMENQTQSTNLTINFSLEAFAASVEIPDNFPPLPQPCFCLTARNSIVRIVLFPGTVESNITVVRDGENILETNGTINDVPNITSGLRYQTINLTDQDYEGEATFNFETNGIDPIAMDAFLFNQ